MVLGRLSWTARRLVAGGAAGAAFGLPGGLSVTAADRSGCSRTVSPLSSSPTAIGSETAGEFESSEVSSWPLPWRESGYDRLAGPEHVQAAMHVYQALAAPAAVKFLQQRRVLEEDAWLEARVVEIATRGTA